MLHDRLMCLFIYPLSVMMTLSFSYGTASAKPQTVPVFPDGSAFGMIPFEGSIKSSEFTGFINMENSSSVLINELPTEAWAEISTQFQEKENLEIAGITAKSIVNSKIADMDALIVSGTQLVRGSDIPKCIILIRGAEKTGMFSAQIPFSENPSQNACDLIKGIAQRAPVALAEKLKALPFALNDLAGMRVIHIVGGSGTVLTDGPLDKVKAAEQPILIVASSLAPSALDHDRTAFSKTLARSIASYTLEDISGIREIAISGRPTIEILATARHSESKETINIVQWVAFAPDGYYLRMIGLASPEKWDDASVKFEQIRDAIDLKRD